MPKSQLLEEESDDSTEKNDTKEKIATGTGSEEVIEVKKYGMKKGWGGLTRLE